MIPNDEFMDEVYRQSRLAMRADVTAEQIAAADAIGRVDASVVRAALSRVPPSWTLTQDFPQGGVFLRGSLKVIFTVQKYDDHRVWVHVSASGVNGYAGGFLPSWEDLKRVKHDFIGEDRWAYQVLPPAKDYVNYNPNVLHLYALMDGSPALPDFTMGLGAI